MTLKTSYFVLGLLTLCFVVGVNAVTVRRQNVGRNSPKQLSPSFEEEWAALEGSDIDSQNEDEVNPLFDFDEDTVEVSDLLEAGQRNDLSQPSRARPFEKIDSASQLNADMEALGIDKAEKNLLNLTQPLPQPTLYDESAPTTPSRFLSTNICGEKFLCRGGDRGPCRPNEIFLPQWNETSSSSISCSGLASSPWNGCFPASRIGSAVALDAAPQGACTLRYPTRPCFGYPPGYRYNKFTKKCYPCSSFNSGVSVSGPCAPNKEFIDIDGVYGMCRCRDRNSLLYRNDNHCYRVYSQGPCSAGEWLEPSINGYGTCKRSPCPSSKCDGRHIYWKASPWSRGGCYKSFARGPCRHGSYFMIEDFPMKRARCVSRYGISYDPSGFSSVWNRGRSRQRKSLQRNLWSN